VKIYLAVLLLSITTASAGMTGLDPDYYGSENVKSMTDEQAKSTVIWFILVAGLVVWWFKKK